MSDPAPATAPIPTQYICLDCKDGELTLGLGADKAFMLALALWDDGTQSHVARKIIIGQWHMSGNELHLRGTGVEITYEASVVEFAVGSNSNSAKAWTWVRSSQETFADRFNMLDRETVETLIRQSISDGGVTPS